MPLGTTHVEGCSQQESPQRELWYGQPHWPLLHVSPAGQAFPHRPQLAGSNWVLTQAPLQHSRPGGQQVPLQAGRPSAQQTSAWAGRSTVRQSHPPTGRHTRSGQHSWPATQHVLQRPPRQPHSFPFGQQLPLMHNSNVTGSQMLPQRPQLSRLVCGFTQTPSQQI